MTDRQADRGDQLMSEIISDPDLAWKKGLTNDLLKEFFRGYPIEKLKALMRHANHAVARQGVWIASELPEAAPELLNDAVALLAHPNRNIRFDALGVIALARGGDRNQHFVHLIKALEDSDAVVGKHALFLLSRIKDAGELATARQYFESTEPKSFHCKGLSLLGDTLSLSSDHIQSLLRSDDPLERKYGLAIAERLYGDRPELLDLAETSQDEVISSLAGHMKRLHSIDKKWKDKRSSE